MLGPQQAAAAGLRPEPQPQHGPARRHQEQRDRREHRVRARFDRHLDRPRRPERRPARRGRLRFRRATPASSRAGTASGSRTSDRRTAPSSTGRGSRRARKLAAGDLVRVGERSEVRGMSRSLGPQHRAFPPGAGSVAATRTPGSASRRSLRSQTAWVARAEARSRPRVAATALGETVDGSGEERVVALIQGGESPGLRACARGCRTPRAWARRSPSPSSRTGRRRSATSAIRAPT